MEILIVDRIVNGIAVLEKEDLSHIEVPVSEFDFKIREGSVVSFFDGKYTENLNEEEKRKQRIALLQKKVFSKNKK